MSDEVLDPVFYTFDAKIGNWTSPRQIRVHKGKRWTICLQAATCYPCSICNSRIFQLKSNIPSTVTWYLKVENKLAFIVFPVDGSNFDKFLQVRDFLESTIKISVVPISDPEYISNDQEIPAPSFCSVSDIKEDKVPKEFKQHSKKQWNEWTNELKSLIIDLPCKSLANNIQLLISAIVFNSYDLKATAMDLNQFYNEKKEELAMFATMGVGGIQARIVQTTFYGVHNPPLGFLNSTLVVYIVFKLPQNDISDGKEQYTEYKARKVMMAMTDAGAWVDIRDAFSHDII